MPDSRIYPSGSTGQKIEVTVEVIVILRPITRTPITCMESRSYPKHPLILQIASPVML